MASEPAIKAHTTRTLRNRGAAAARLRPDFRTGVLQRATGRRETAPGGHGAFVTTPLFPGPQRLRRGGHDARIPLHHLGGRGPAQERAAP